jgi:RHH-type transcriptional regulator, rel operon repressor / antitoxin RelB
VRVPFIFLDKKNTGDFNVIINITLIMEYFMAKTALMSVRMPEGLAERLENLAKATERSKSYLAALAIEEFVAVQEWQVQAIQEGVSEAEAGKVVGRDEALKELKRWGKK